MTEAELDALDAECVQWQRFIESQYVREARDQAKVGDVLRRAAAAITALRKREVTEAMVVAAARKYRPRVGMSFAAHCKFMRDALQAAFAQAEAEKP